MKGRISGVRDEKPYCWEVLIDDGEFAMAFEWPRQMKPEEGEDAEWIDGEGIRWRGIIVPVDLQKPRLDDGGELYFD